MTNYTKSTNFATKDSLPVGNALKVVKGTEIDTEFNNIASAVATKADVASPTLLGNPSRSINPPVDDSSLQLATCNWVQNELATEVIAINAAKAPIASPTFTGVPAAPTAAVDTTTTQLATTAFVIAQAATVAPLANGTAAVGTSKKYARQDHVHPIVISTATAVATTSGTSVTFNNIPSWAKRITFMLAGFSTNGSSVPQFRLGTSSGLEVTGYVGETGAFGGSGATGIITSTIGVPLQNSYGASQLLSGTITCVLMNASTNTWVITAVLGNTNNVMTFVGYSKSLALPLTQVYLSTVNATDVFNAGSVNILYE